MSSTNEDTNYVDPKYLVVTYQHEAIQSLPEWKQTLDDWKSASKTHHVADLQGHIERLEETLKTIEYLQTHYTSFNQNLFIRQIQEDTGSIKKLIAQHQRL